MYIYETQIHSTALSVDTVYQLSTKSVNKYRNYGYKFLYIPKKSVTIIGLIFFYNLLYRISWKSDKRSTRSQADGLLDMVSTQDFNILIRKERLK